MSQLSRSVIERVGSKGLTSEWAAQMGQAYWGDKLDGQAVDMYSYQIEAHDKFQKAGVTAYVPWLPSVMDEIYHDYVFNTNPQQMSTGQFGDYAQKAKDRVQKNMEEYLTKAYDQAEEQLTGIKKATTTTQLSNMMHVIADQEVTY
jgi:hypothetical protein